MPFRIVILTDLLHFYRPAAMIDDSAFLQRRATFQGDYLLTGAQSMEQEEHFDV